MQARLRFFRAKFVQFHAIGEAVVTLRKLAQGFSAATAGIENVGGHVLRKLDTPQDMADVIRIGGIIPHPHLIHQAADDLGVYRILSFRELLREPVQ